MAPSLPDTCATALLPNHAESTELQHEPNHTNLNFSTMATNSHLEESSMSSHWQSPKDEASVLKGLTEGVRNQEDLEKDINQQANLVLIEKEDERDKKKIERLNANKGKIHARRETHRRRRDAPGFHAVARGQEQKEIDRLDTEIAVISEEIIEFEQRIEKRHQDNEEIMEDQHGGSRRLQNESQRDFLIRTGKITPFALMSASTRSAQIVEGDLADALRDAEETVEVGMMVEADVGPKSHQNLHLPGFAETSSSSGISTPAEDEFSLRPPKKKRLPNGRAVSSGQVSYEYTRPRKTPSDASSPGSSATDSDFENLLDEDDEIVVGGKRPKKPSTVEETDDLAGIDDGNEKVYQARLKSWIERRSRARLNKQKPNATEIANDLDVEEWFKPSPDAPDHHFENGLKLPGDIYPSLFDYQKTGVQWLGELYSQQVGGIVGDEMGLGKTIQIISFLAGLHYSKKLTQPVIVVAPATVLRQWVNEFHLWWPALRVSILHSSGSGMLNYKDEGRVEEDEESSIYGRDGRRKVSKSSKAAKCIVDKVVKQGHVLVTTYAGLQTYSDLIIPIKWGYAVLDEGHKIRNPNAAITIHCKELRTANRVILSGTPMQNNLIELWSLFDFVYPMRLGTLVNFRNQFEIPIKVGGYASATSLQIMTATKCAEMLKEAISRYLLQRVKADVAADLPKKSEQVLFCKLTKPQREAYEAFLNSDDLTSILNKTRQSLFGIDILRKVCNHPDLLDPKLRKKRGYKWGNPNKSGKMQVVKALLEMWKNKGDKVLLFSQGVQMLDIIEEYVKGLNGFNYLRMDGTTTIKDRQSMVDKFNYDPEMHVFLLTTKVGGLGVNLTGANRVIIFDPDWNPSTDVQARERAWRLGQKKEVTIYRLMTAGTIEEKIYHRQIFKQFLSDKILKDPKQRQTFHVKDLYDLFTLGTSDGPTETGELFKGSEVQLGKSRNSTDRTTRAPQDYGWGDETLLPPMKQVNDGIPWGGAAIPNPTEPVSSLRRENGEVSKITGVAGLEEYHDDDEEKPANGEARIMEGIFARSGVQSVLEHDHIINGKRVVQPDRRTLEREAKRVAAEAATELRKAAEEARSVPIGTVTWTGEVGEAGRPVNLRRGGGPSSSGVLAGLANRQGLGNSGAGSSRSGTPDGGPEGKDFTRLIWDYIRLHGGSVPSQMLIVHFNHMCKTERQTEAFKASLQEVATLQPGERGRRGKWHLNEEFK